MADSRLDSPEASHSLETSCHARFRMQQRGISTADVDLIMFYGSETHRGFTITRKDGQVAIRALKKEIDRIEKVAKKQTLLIIKDNCLVTVFPATDTQLKKKNRQRQNYSNTRESFRSSPDVS